ncbi:hypothetical protein REPUB_Repub03eG0260700 [Reevesia pubescens]
MSLHSSELMHRLFLELEIFEEQVGTALNAEDAKAAINWTQISYESCYSEGEGASAKTMAHKRDEPCFSMLDEEKVCEDEHKENWNNGCPKPL